MGFRLSLNETIVEIAILELENTSYSILWLFPNLQILNLFLGKKNILGFEILIVKYMFYIFRIMAY
jgi:hypothetical protein